jgi:hypothetical protein
MIAKLRLSFLLRTNPALCEAPDSELITQSAHTCRRAERHIGPGVPPALFEGRSWIPLIVKARPASYEARKFCKTPVGRTVAGYVEKCNQSFSSSCSIKVRLFCIVRGVPSITHAGTARDGCPSPPFTGQGIMRFQKEDFGARFVATPNTSLAKSAEL